MSKAFGQRAIAIGFRAKAGDPTTAVGSDAVATGLHATALGSESQATGDLSVALGHSSVANAPNSTALGAGAQAASVVLPSITGGSSRANQRGPASFVTTDSNGVMATTSFSVDDLLSDVRSNQKEARKGIAAAMAMTAASMPSAPGRTSWTSNVAAFRGEFAFGASFAHRFDTEFPLAATGGYAYGGGDNHGFRVGLQGEF